VTHERGQDGRSALRLSPFRLYSVYVSAGGVWISGVLWLIYHYFMREEGPFGIQNHPMEGVWLSMHGALAFFLVWAFGMLWAIHIVRGWNVNWRRWSGGSLVGATVVLTVTGIGLYYIGSTKIQNGVSLVHWIVGITALPLFLFHWLSWSVPRLRQRAEKRVRV
jgi:hypothetical protein